MTTPFDTKKFKSLKATWDKKLALSGFEDIENPDGSLKATTDSRTIKNALKGKEERETYYSIARGLLNSNTFSNFETFYREIWELHCEGIGVRTIAKKLKMTSYKVEITILRLQKLAKLKKEKK